MTAASVAAYAARSRLFAALVLAVSAVLTQRAGGQQPPDSTRELIKARVRANSPLLVERQAAVDLARARHAAAGARLPATLSAEAEEVPDAVNLARAQSLRMDVARELLPRSRRSSERAVAAVDVSRAETALELTRRALDLSVDQLLVRAAGSAAIAARLASEDSLLRGAEEALRARFAVADARFVDVLRLRTERLRNETEMFRARADERIATRALVRLGGADTATVFQLVAAATGSERAAFEHGLPPLPSLDSTIAVSGARQLAQLAVQRAVAGQRLARAETRSSITPSVGVQRFGDAGASSVGITVGVAVALPFTAAGSNRARLVVADREVAHANAARLAAETSLATALSIAADEYETARGQIASFDAALLRGAREEREAALAAYRNGGMSLVELLDFERALADVEVARIRSQLAAAAALTTYLTTALGIPELGGTP